MQLVGSMAAHRASSRATKSGKKVLTIRGIKKLDDANDAGGAKSRQCTLILTEGDSAKTLAVCGLGVVGRDKYGVFPLKGKPLNVREASQKKIKTRQNPAFLLRKSRKPAFLEVFYFKL